MVCLWLAMTTCVMLAVLVVEQEGGGIHARKGEGSEICTLVIQS